MPDNQPTIEAEKPLVFEAPAPLHVAAGVDSIVYRAAKAQAEREGRTLIIDPPPARAAITHAPGTVLIPKDASVTEYRRLKNDAEQRGVPYAITEQGAA